MARVFIDGEAGTTGLKIRERLEGRDDIELIRISGERRRDRGARKAAFDEADVAILCLPDDAAREAVSMAGATRVIDASSAHRTHDAWVYGMPELPGQRDRIREARLVSNVGCYATGAIAMLRPLVDAGLMRPADGAVLTGVSGYTGGGKALIAEAASGEMPHLFAYGLRQDHKHVPEIVKRAGLTRRPVFTPMVGRFPQGMLVMLHLHADLLPGGLPGTARLEAALREAYRGDPFVSVVLPGERLDPERLVGTNRMEISVQGDGEGRATVAAVLDNLGKGASGTAVQNLNLMIGAEEAAGLA